MNKGIITTVVLAIVLVVGITGFAVCTTNIGAGYVGYKYDRTIKNGAPRHIGNRRSAYRSRLDQSYDSGSS